MKLVKLIPAVLLAGALGAGSASATLLTLNPSAPNVGCTDLHGGACGPVGTNGPFLTDNAHLAFTGIVDINSGAGVPNAASTYTETGLFRILDFDNSTLPPGSTQLPASQTGVNRSQGGNYEIYGTFSGNGGGVWSPTGFNFLTTSINLTVSLFAAPPGSTPTLGNSGVTPGAEDFLLGTATLVANSSNLGTASISAFNVASQSLDALLQFIPAGGPNGPLTGPGGFFSAPVPFILSLGSHAGGNALNTTWVPFGNGGVEIRTLDLRGGGDVSFAVAPNQVAEPGPLALLGLGLVTMGFVSYGARLRSRS